MYVLIDVMLMFGQYVVDVLWCQQIKLIQAVSTSEFMNIDGTTLILFFCPLHLVQGLRSNNIKQVITTLIFKLGKSQGPFLILKSRVTFTVKTFLKIEIFWGHEVLKLYFQWSKNSRSLNIRALKYLFFNEESKFLVKNCRTYFMKKSMFEASEALH